MCGIVGMVGQRNVSPILIEGLKRLEYRGYDSAGVAIIDDGNISSFKVEGKVSALSKRLETDPISGHTGIAHTRWATHGAPSERNAHPHVIDHQLAIVHNGIVENHSEIKIDLESRNYFFKSETDSEVIGCLIYDLLKKSSSLFEAVNSAIKQVEGAFALCLCSIDNSDELIVARRGSPVVIGLGIGENFVASDVFALLPVTQRFIFLEEGDVAVVKKHSVSIFDSLGQKVDRKEKISELSAEATSKGGFRHFMLKEIFEQPKAIAETIFEQQNFLDIQNRKVLKKFTRYESVEAITIVACGTSFHAGLVAKYWMESQIGISCNVEVASEFRYRNPAVLKNSMFIVISQSGETADSLAALRTAMTLGYLTTVAICNVPESTLTREAEETILTKAGPEIGVASTKAFTTQLVSLLILTQRIAIAKRKDLDEVCNILGDLQMLPGKIDNILGLNQQITAVSDRLGSKHNALFLGRGTMYPIAMEGALKLKEISYIHAEAYPAGELKHGPLALVDETMPVVSVAPNNSLVSKLKANLEEVRARGGEFLVFADGEVSMELGDNATVITLPKLSNILSPICYTVPLQLLAYHVAVSRGSDVDQPRNLAKSVTVE